MAELFYVAGISDHVAAFLFNCKEKQEREGT